MTGDTLQPRLRRHHSIILAEGVARRAGGGALVEAA